MLFLDAINSEIWWSTFSAIVAGVVLLWISLVVAWCSKRRSQNNKSLVVLKIIYDEISHNVVLMREMVKKSVFFRPYFRLGTIRINYLLSLMPDVKKDDVELLIDIGRMYDQYDLINRQLDILHFKQGLDAPIYVQSTLPLVISEIDESTKLLKRMKQRVKRRSFLSRPIRRNNSIDVEDNSCSTEESTIPSSQPNKITYKDICAARVKAIEDYEEYRKCLVCLIRCFQTCLKCKLEVPNHVYSVVKDEKSDSLTEDGKLKILEDGSMRFVIEIKLSRAGLGELPWFNLHQTYSVKMVDGVFHIKVFHDLPPFRIPKGDIERLCEVVDSIITLTWKFFSKNPASIISSQDGKNYYFGLKIEE